MHQMGKTPAPKKPPSTRFGLGRYTKHVLLLAAALAGYFGFMFQESYVRAYQSKAFGKVACNDMSRESRWGILDDSDKSRWERTFKTNLGGIGLKLQPEQYSFEMVENADGKPVCKGTIAFDQINEWPVLGDYLPSLKPVRTVHRFSFETAYREHY